MQNLDRYFFLVYYFKYEELEIIYNFLKNWNVPIYSYLNFIDDCFQNSHLKSQLST